MVTPLAGVWIEIFVANLKELKNFASHPSRVCGLKFAAAAKGRVDHARHTPRGCVD